jgi:alanyl-tRNA synthetase
MTSDDIRARFLAFFEKRGHTVIPSASLVPNEEVGAAASSQTLFTTAGMQPLIPYLLGKPHPAGKRLVDCQKCVRTGDIDDVGDNRHLTFFEMLGNWSLGDYFKKEAIEWSFEFLTSKTDGLGLDPKRLYVTVFKGENGIPRDEEAIAIWQNVFKRAVLTNGVAGDDEKMGPNLRIFPLGVKDNFWIAGTTGPCGGDTEMFYDTRPEAGVLEGKFGDIVDSFRLIEVWNDVFMEFNKTADGQYEKLASKNVDTGMGLERTTAVVNGKSTVFETDAFVAILEEIRKHAKIQNEKSERIIADHMRTAVFMIADGVTPSNTDRGYILRRLLRRSIRHSDILEMSENLSVIADIIQKKYQKVYPEVVGTDNGVAIRKIIQEEEQKFSATIKEGLREFEKIAKKTKEISAEQAFQMFSSYGLPIEVILELGKEKGLYVETKGFEEAAKKHQELSRAGADKKFKGGLGDTSEKSLQYHTATHLLNAALKQVLGPHVGQKGSNITPERLRFDFSYPEKMTDEQKKKVESLVNGWISAALPVDFKEMPKTEAEKIATHAFNEKYGDMVKVYSIGTEGKYISREFCGGPHVANTRELAGPEGKWTFKIQKEEAVSAGVRRIKAVLTN